MKLRDELLTWLQRKCWNEVRKIERQIFVVIQNELANRKILNHKKNTKLHVR